MLNGATVNLDLGHHSGKLVEDPKSWKVRPIPEVEEQHLVVHNNQIQIRLAGGAKE